MPINSVIHIDMRLYIGELCIPQLLKYMFLCRTGTYLLALRACPIFLYSDDTSGNRSKKWNCFNLWCIQQAALPRIENARSHAQNYISINIGEHNTIATAYHI